MKLQNPSILASECVPSGTHTLTIAVVAGSVIVLAVIAAAFVARRRRKHRPKAAASTAQRWYPAVSAPGTWILTQLASPERHFPLALEPGVHGLFIKLRRGLEETRVDPVLTAFCRVALSQGVVGAELDMRGRVVPHFAAAGVVFNELPFLMVRGQSVTDNAITLAVTLRNDVEIYPLRVSVELAGAAGGTKRLVLRLERDDLKDDPAPTPSGQAD